MLANHSWLMICCLYKSNYAFIMSIYHRLKKSKISCNALGCSKCGNLGSWLMILHVYKFSCVIITSCQYIIFKKHEQVKHGWVVLESSKCRGLHSWSMILCLYKYNYVWIISKHHRKQQNQTSKRHRYVTMPWDVPTVGAPATDWWFYVYIDVVMY